MLVLNGNIAEPFASPQHPCAGLQEPGSMQALEAELSGGAGPSGEDEDDEDDEEEEGEEPSGTSSKGSSTQAAKQGQGPSRPGGKGGGEGGGGGANSAAAWGFLATCVKDHGAVRAAISLLQHAHALEPLNASYALNLAHALELEQDLGAVLAVAAETFQTLHSQAAAAAANGQPGMGPGSAAASGKGEGAASHPMLRLAGGVSLEVGAAAWDAAGVWAYPSCGKGPPATPRLHTTLLAKPGPHAPDPVHPGGGGVAARVAPPRATCDLHSLAGCRGLAAWQLAAWSGRGL